MEDYLLILATNWQQHIQLVVGFGTKSLGRKVAKYATVGHLRDYLEVGRHSINLYNSVENSIFKCPSVCLWIFHIQVSIKVFVFVADFRYHYTVILLWGWLTNVLLKGRIPFRRRHWGRIAIQIENKEMRKPMFRNAGDFVDNLTYKNALIWSDDS